jgi:hypothetical protein
VKVCESSPYDWVDDLWRPYIYSFFRAIIHAAMLSTPITSPVKTDPEFFSRDPKIDLGMKAQWETLFINDDDSEVEFVELPFTSSPR